MSTSTSPTPTPTPNKLVRQRSAGKKVSTSKYILGIDVGTTSVKLCLLDQKSGEVSDKFVKDTLAGAASDCGPAGDLQVGVSSLIVHVLLRLSLLRLEPYSWIAFKWLGWMTKLLG